MTLPRLKAMNQEWERVPPLAESANLLLRVLGWKAAPGTTATDQCDTAYRRLVAETEFE